MKHITYVLAACALMAGCAEMETANNNDQGYEEKQVVTGSNIPRRKSQNMDVYNKESAEAGMGMRPLTMPSAGTPRN